MVLHARRPTPRSKARVDALGRDDREITLLVAAGGIGKTRLIEEAVGCVAAQSRVASGR